MEEKITREGKLRETLTVSRDGYNIVLTARYRRSLGDPIEADVDHILSVVAANTLMSSIMEKIEEVARLMLMEGEKNETQEGKRDV
jgi:hypothetical protein